MKRPIAQTELFGESLQKRKIAAFTLSERFYRPFFSTPEHAHENALFCLVLKGSYTETYGSRKVDCTPSTLLFHAGDFPHAEHYHAGGGHSFIVEIEKKWLANVREQIDFPAHSVDFKNGNLPGLGARLYEEFRHSDQVSPLIIEGLMLEIAGETARRNSVVETRLPEWLKTVEEILQARHTEPLTLSEIARCVQIHPVHLAQTFRKYRHTTVGNRLREIRLENARRRLIETKNPLIEIALEHGFADQSHFSRLFKRRYAVSPKEYRRICKS